MLLYIIVVGILTFINPILGAVGVFACVGFHILKSILFGDKNDKKDERKKQDDAPHTEYDEFDWWQDNQGL